MNETSAIFNPFPGLRPFEAHENHLFFGRDGQSDELLTRLRRNRFLAVVGTSGSGKSSLVRAGMLPALYGGMMAKAGSRWRLAIFRPGDAPIRNLAEALNAGHVFGREGERAKIYEHLVETSLRRGAVGLIEAVQEARLPAHDNLLIVVDQFEELFRFKQAAQSIESVDEASAFVKLLVEAAKQYQAAIYVVLTMRSDYLGDCAQFRDLPEVINDGQYLIPRMTRDQRREAITGPVAVGGATMTPRLINRLLNDVGDNPDQLPILQHALMRTWDYWAQHHQDAEPIDVPHYEAIGGMEKALSLHADEAYNELPTPRSQTIAEKLFKALTEKGEDNREIRRPILLRDAGALVEAPEREVAAVVEIFRRSGRTFLMPPAEVKLHAGTLIDISHESLIRNWERLRKWVDEEAQSAQIYRRLAETATLYQQSKAGLWRDPDLQIALEWQKQNRPNEVWAQRYFSQFSSAIKFLEKSQVARDAEIAEKETIRQRELQQAQVLAEEQRLRAESERERAEEQRRAASRLRRGAVILALVGLVAVIAAVGASLLYISLRKASGELDEVKRRVVEAQAIADSAKAAAESAMALAENARLLAEEKLKVAKRQSQIADSLGQEAGRLQGLVKSRAHAADSLQKVADWATKLADSLKVVAENNLREAERLRGLSTALFLAAQAVLPPSLQPNDTLAVRLARGAFFLNLNNGGRNDNEIYEALRSALNRPSFNSAGGPLRSGQHKDWGETVAFSPDGNWVASGGADSSVVVWSFGQNHSGAVSHYGHNASVGSVAFDPDGRILASGSDDHKIGLWSEWKKADAVPRMLEGPKDRIWSVAFSRNKMLAAGCADSTIILWNIEREGGSPTFLKQHQGSVRSVAFSPDGLMLASGSTDATIRLWDIRTLDSSQPRVLNSKSRARVRAVAFSPDGRFLAAACEDGAIRLWNLSQLDEAPKELGGHEGPANAVAFSSNDSLLASAGADRTARIWNLNQRTKGPVITLKHEQWVWAVAFSPDGKRLATASSDKTIRIWASSSEALVGISQEKVERDLTRREWEQVVGEKIPYEPKQLRVRGGK